MKALRALIVEDNPSDAELSIIELERFGFDVYWKRVESPKGLREALRTETWDVILCDYDMPQLDAIGAWMLLQRENLDIPFLIVSGQIGEELAVSCMKTGVHDYIMKNNLSRLGAAVDRELKEAEVRRQRAKAEEARRNAERDRMELLKKERTAREEAERLFIEANRANRMKDEFLATISHELRTPLNVILGWAELLREERLDDDERKIAIDSLYKNAKSQSEMIEGILDASLLTRGSFKLQSKWMNLQPVVESVVQSFAVATATKHLNLRSIIDEHAGPVLGDPVRLRQVLSKLISNAIKFTPPGGDIVVELRRNANSVELIVEDSGEGIGAEFMPYIFKKFHQEDASLTRRHGGIGLGLSLASDIVTLHGGEIDVDSHGKGKGARFTVRLPSKGTNSVGAPKRPEKGRLLSGLTVMVIDDEKDLLYLVQAILEKYGARVITEDTAKSALQALSVVRPDVILCDVGMPEMDGYAFVKALRRWEKKKGLHIPTIAFTAYAAKKDREEALASGFDAHLAKPVESAQLVSAVDRIKAALQ